MKNTLKTLTYLLTFILACSFWGCTSETKPEEPVLDDYDIYEVKVRSSLALRMGPSKDSQKLMNLTNGQHLAVVDIEGEWAKILVQDTPAEYAYANAKYLKFIEEGRRSSQNLNSEPDEEPAVAEQSSPAQTAQIAEEPDTVVNHMRVFNDRHILSNKEYEELSTITSSDGLVLAFSAIDSVSPSNIYNLADIALDSAYIALNTIPKDKIIAFCYVRKNNFLTFKSENNHLKDFTKQAQSDLFRIQYQLYTNNISLYEATLQIADLLSVEYRTYENSNWFQKIRAGSSYYIDVVLDDFIVRSIVSHDDYWLTKIIRNLFKYPYAAARRSVGLTNSVWLSLILTALMIIMLHLIIFFSSRYTNKKTAKGGNISGLFLLLNLFIIIFLAFLTLMMISFMVYFSPSIENIAAISESGTISSEQIIFTIDSYLDEPLNVSWIVYVCFVVIFTVNSSIDRDFVIWGLACSKVQKSVLKEQLEHKGNILKGLALYNLTSDTNISDSEKLQQLDYPFSELATHKFGTRFGEVIFPISAVGGVINGTLVIFGVIFFGYKLIIKCMLIFLNYLELKHMKLLRKWK